MGALVLIEVAATLHQRVRRVSCRAAVLAVGVVVGGCARPCAYVAGLRRSGFRRRSMITFAHAASP